MDIEEKIKAIEEEIARTQKNKATERHIGLLKAKIAKLREQIIKSSTKKASQYSVKKEGDATVVLLGFPSVGKSTLLSLLTNAKSKIAEYAFTTLKPIPGMMDYEDMKIQIIDIPGIIKGASQGKGGGKEVISIARNADLLVFLLDVNNPEEQLKQLMHEIKNLGIRPGEKPPNIYIKKKEKGGITIFSPYDVNKEVITSVLNSYGIHNAYITINEKLDDIERLIDAIFKNRVYIPYIVVINKGDLLSKEEKEYYEKHLNALIISAQKKENIEKLKSLIAKALDLIKVYTKNKENKIAKKPLYLKKDSTIKDLCKKIHSDFLKYFKFAQVWGESVKFPGQRVGLDHKLKNNDIVKIVLK